VYGGLIEQLNHEPNNYSFTDKLGRTGYFPLDMFEGRCDAIVINVDSVNSKTKEFPFDYQKGSE